MTTQFHSEDIKSSATKLGDIMNDGVMSAFNDLKAQWPNAGGFDTAQWLERIVDDRRNGVVAHAEHLKLALNDMKTSLTTIATDFQNADGENAGKIKTKIDDLQSTITKDVSGLDEGTEKDQHNFTDGDEKPEDNKSDGDGYDDVL